MRRRLARKILLVGWDAADWRVATPLLDRGQMPHLARFVEHGVNSVISRASSRSCRRCSGMPGRHRQAAALARRSCMLRRGRPVGGRNGFRSCRQRHAARPRPLWNILVAVWAPVSIAVGWHVSDPAEAILARGFGSSDASHSRTISALVPLVGQRNRSMRTSSRPPLHPRDRRASPASVLPPPRGGPALRGRVHRYSSRRAGHALRCTPPPRTCITVELWDLIAVVRTTRSTISRTRSCTTTRRAWTVSRM